MSIDKLISNIKSKNNPSVVGLDPKLEYVPNFIKQKHFEVYGKNLKGAAHAIWEFNISLIDALYDIVPAVKPQSAYYEMYGIEGLKVLQKTIQYAKKKGLFVITDVKRNDIGSTAEAYATAYLGMTDIDGRMVGAFESDSVTVSPYLGTDGILPFINACNQYNRSIFVLVRTSNHSSGELQDLMVGQEAIFEKVAHLVKQWGASSIGESGYNNVGAVIGATYPQQAAVLRKLLTNTYFLVPGYGAQGGSAQDVIPCFNKDGLGAIVNSSRGILCAYMKQQRKEEDFALAAREEAIRMRDEINRYL